MAADSVWHQLLRHNQSRSTAHRWLAFPNRADASALAATIRTASRTTASLSDAKNLKLGPRCQEGRTEEIVAMICAQFPQERRAVQLSSSSSRASVEGPRRESFKVTSAGFLDSARNDGKISADCSAMPSLFSLASGLARWRADFFAPSPTGAETQIHFPALLLFAARILGRRASAITSSRPSSVCGSVWYNVKPSRSSDDRRRP